MFLLCKIAAKVIQDHFDPLHLSHFKLHLRSAILSLILHCIVPDQVTNPLIGETTVKRVKRSGFFFFQGIWEEDSVAKSHGSRFFRCGLKLSEVLRMQMDTNGEAN